MRSIDLSQNFPQEQGTCNIIRKLLTRMMKPHSLVPCVLSNSNVSWMATLSTLVRYILHASATHITSLRDLPRASATESVCVRLHACIMHVSGWMRSEACRWLLPISFKPSCILIIPPRSTRVRQSPSKRCGSCLDTALTYLNCDAINLAGLDSFMAIALAADRLEYVLCEAISTRMLSLLPHSSRRGFVWDPGRLAPSA